MDTLVDAQVASGSNVELTLVGDLTAVDIRMEQLTLLRTIIGIDLAYLIHDAGEGSQDVFVSIAIASQDAFAVAGTALPFAQTQGDHPTRGWIWRARYRLYGFAADQAAVFNRRVDLDIRARRKLDNGECYIRVENVADQGVATTINMIGLIRQLWLVT